MACPEEGQKSKKSFKGVEGFLRRVAFNLGNSPSQTEVKIISCIPIDVTDLQQKIIHLERQLEEANRVRDRAQTQCRLAVHTALTAPECTACAAGAEPGPAATYSPAFDTACAADCAPTPPNCAQSPENCPRRKSNVSSKSSRGQQREPLCSNATCNDVETRKRNLFKRHKKARRDSPLVYYAHTTTSPFSNYEKDVAARRKTKTDAPVRAPHVSDVLRKLYLPELYFEEWTGSSQASAPVCRDRSRAPPTCTRDADACSCCRGCYYDLDRDYRPHRFLDDAPATSMYQNVDSGNIYYNSSYYDIFPVKEKSDTVKRENDKFKKWDPKFYGDKCFQNDYQTKIECRPVLANTKFSPTRCAKNSPRKFPNRRHNGAKRIWRTNESSRNTLVECGDIYIKRAVAKKHKFKQCNKTVLLKNVECLTHNVNDTECQTESSKNLRPETTDLSDESRTETTLGQIKTILQSVLSHVKTNNQTKLQADNRDKKDAIVQKELQSNSPACSRLLNSFTYSPFSMDPYMASCSRAVPAGPCAPLMMAPQVPAPSSHFKCMQNFPVFIQHTPAQRQCSGCHHPRPDVNRNPMPTSTNTMLPAEEKRSKETENLIKEIYKSMALNIPIKPVSQSDNNDRKVTNVTRIESGEPVISNVMMMSRQVGSEAQNRPLAVSTATTSRATSSTRSASGATGRPCTAGAPRRRAACDSGTTSSTEQPRRKMDVVAESDSPSEEEAESASTSSSNSGDTVVPSKQAAKETANKGIFKKMFGSVFKRRRKVKQEDRASSAAESESDSDDYQTVYSQKVELPRRVPHAPPRVRSRTKRSLQRLQRGRRSPYMDQEHRRCWDEQLMFQKQPPKHSSERAPTRPLSVRSRPPGIYFHKCEARHAVIDAPGPFLEPNPDHEQERVGSLPRPRKNVSLKVSNRRVSWLKRHSPNVKCADQWKRLMLDN